MTIRGAWTVLTVVILAVCDVVVSLHQLQDEALTYEYKEHKTPRQPYGQTRTERRSHPTHFYGAYAEASVLASQFEWPRVLPLIAAAQAVVVTFNKHMAPMSRPNSLPLCSPRQPATLRRAHVLGQKVFRSVRPSAPPIAGVVATTPAPYRG